METGKNEQVAALVAKAEALLRDEAVEAAHALLRAGIETHNHVRLWRVLRRVLLILGEEEEARQVMVRIIGRINAPTPDELAFARSPRSAFTRLSRHKILYLHVPKCGSTTVKDMLYYVLTGTRSEGLSHLLMAEQAPYLYADRSQIGVHHGTWFKFLVARDPIARLRSYYRFNLVFSNDLAKEVPGRESYLGLKIQPSYDELLQNLARYRQVFSTLRIHTNALTDIAGDDPGIFDWVGPVRDMDSLRVRLGEKTGLAIPPVHNFRSAEMATIVPNEALEDRVRESYRTDYDIFGRYF